MKKIVVIIVINLNLICTVFYPNTNEAKSYTVSICSIFRNEARFLREWIEFHQLVGIEHFYLLNNLSTDNYLDVLKPYIDSGIVEIYDWPHEANSKKSWHNIQCSAIEFIIKKCTKKTQWLAIIDADEFLFCKVEDDIKNYLKQFKKFAGINVNRITFGSSSIEKVPSDKLLIETFIKCLPKNHKENQLTRCIIQPNKVKKCKDPHIMIFKKNNFGVNENLQRITKPISPYSKSNKLQINHYWTRDLEYFYLTKLPRRFLHGDSVERSLTRDEQTNEKEDSILKLKFIEKLKKILKK